jgi:hypothetical protein
MSRNQSDNKIGKAVDYEYPGGKKVQIPADGRDIEIRTNWEFDHRGITKVSSLSPIEFGMRPEDKRSARYQ